ncbi:MAG: Cycloisomaltooligosaccharide glucanotransferase precursor [Daejeonella sp.]|nr:Cycloisomaltooligosaccharide glucanotransferase precursor [Daejeonella sp.]
MVEYFDSEPVYVYPETATQVVEMEEVLPKSDLPYKGFTGTGFAEINKQKNTSFQINISALEAGLYALDFKYANGNGPINTENKCAIRTFVLNNSQTGTFVFPQRGKGEWSNWGFSNANKVQLHKGPNTLTLAFKPENENMNGEINQAMLDCLRIIKIQ